MSPPNGKLNAPSAARLIRKKLDRACRWIGVNVLPDRLLVPVENGRSVLREVDRERPGVRREREAGAIA